MGMKMERGLHESYLKDKLACMNKTLKVVLVSMAILLVLLGIGRTLQFFKAQRTERERKTSFAVAGEKTFVLVIPSYNNSRFCEQNLASVLNQNYQNFRVIYIDDASNDQTYEKVKELLSQSAKGDKVTLLRNPHNMGALANIYNAVQTCQDTEIVVCVDGDDFLAHPEVLNKLNHAYADPKVWMTYGNYLDYPTYKQKPSMCKKIPMKVIQTNTFRTAPWVTSHLKTFYAGLFKKVKQEDLLYEGRFVPMAWDLAFMFPMLEMSGKHVAFIRDTLYLYNRSNPINDHKVNLSLQQACERHLRSLPKYEKLEELSLH
jgi:glycosyltransferase involved in cell wall biosynthesis